MTPTELHARGANERGVCASRPRGDGSGTAASRRSNASSSLWLRAAPRGEGRERVAPGRHTPTLPGPTGPTRLWTRVPEPRHSRDRSRGGRCRARRGVRNETRSPALIAFSIRTSSTATRRARRSSLVTPICLAAPPRSIAGRSGAQPRRGASPMDPRATRDGLHVPEPPEDEPSGRVCCACPRSLHAELDRVASEKGSSLNLMLNVILAEYVGRFDYREEMRELRETLRSAVNELQRVDKVAVCRPAVRPVGKNARGSPRGRRRGTAQSGHGRRPPEPTAADQVVDSPDDSRVGALLFDIDVRGPGRKPQADP